MSTNTETEHSTLENQAKVDSVSLKVKAAEQNIERVSLAIIKDLKLSDRLNPEQVAKLREVVPALLNANLEGGVDLVKAKQSISSQLNAISAKDFTKIIESLNKIIKTDQSKSIGNLIGYNSAEFALDLLKELSDPQRNIHQGSSLACAVTSRMFIKNNPASYAQCMADMYSTGKGFVHRDTDGVGYGLVGLNQGLLSAFSLKDRETAPMALYQDALLYKFGSPAEGLLPADVEQFMEARGMACRLYTSNSEVSSACIQKDQIIKEILECAKSGRSASLSLEFAEEGSSHNKHILELCSSEGVPNGYVKLSNPWDINQELPERYQGKVKTLADGTFLIKIEDLKDNLYFACVETGKIEDYGTSPDLKKGIYKGLVHGGLDSLHASYFGFSHFLEIQKKKSQKYETAIKAN